jgi:putative membrane protein
MQFWCSAQGIAWSWTWRPYLGIWLVVAAVAAGYAVSFARAGREPSRRLTSTMGHRVTAIGGVVLLWLSLDWPLGTLGAGYLLSVHTIQFILITLVVAPLLLRSAPWPVTRRAGVLAGLARRPLLAAGVFNVLMVVTHLPIVTDTLMTSQVGAFALDVAWVGGGLALWAPLLVPSDRSPLAPMLQVLYLFLASLPSSLVGAILTYAEFPLYSVYELAPRVSMIAAHDDQQVAGLIMWVGGFFIVLGVISTIFLRWAYREERMA